KSGNGLAIILEFWPSGMRDGVSEANRLAELIFSWQREVYIFEHSGCGQLRKLSLKTLLDGICGSLHPSKQSYVNLLVAPDDGRIGRLARFIGPAWESQHWW